MMQVNNEKLRICIAHLAYILLLSFVSCFSWNFSTNFFNKNNLCSQTFKLASFSKRQWGLLAGGLSLSAMGYVYRDTFSKKQWTAMGSCLLLSTIGCIYWNQIKKFVQNKFSKSPEPGSKKQEESSVRKDRSREKSPEYIAHGRSSKKITLNENELEEAKKKSLEKNPEHEWWVKRHFYLTASLSKYKGSYKTEREKHLDDFLFTASPELQRQTVDTFIAHNDKDGSALARLKSDEDYKNIQNYVLSFAQQPSHLKNFYSMSAEEQIKHAEKKQKEGYENFEAFAQEDQRARSIPPFSRSDYDKKDEITGESEDEEVDVLGCFEDGLLESDPLDENQISKNCKRLEDISQGIVNERKRIAESIKNRVTVVHLLSDRPSQQCSRHDVLEALKDQGYVTHDKRAKKGISQDTIFEIGKAEKSPYGKGDYEPCRVSMRLWRLHAQLFEEGGLMRLILGSIEKILNDLSDENEWYFEKIKKKDLDPEEQAYAAELAKKFDNSKIQNFKWEEFKIVDGQATMEMLIKKAKDVFELLKKRGIAEDDHPKIASTLEFLGEYFLYAKKVFTTRPIICLGDPEATGVLGPSLIAAAAEKKSTGRTLHPCILGDCTDRGLNDLGELAAMVRFILENDGEDGTLIAGNHERSAYSYRADDKCVNLVLQYFLQWNPYFENVETLNRIFYLRRLLVVIWPVEIYVKRKIKFDMNGQKYEREGFWGAHAMKDPVFSHKKFMKKKDKTYAPMTPFYINEIVKNKENLAEKTVYLLPVTIRGLCRFRRELGDKDKPLFDGLEKGYYTDENGNFMQVCTWGDVRRQTIFTPGRGLCLSAQNRHKLFLIAYGKEEDIPLIIRGHEHNQETVEDILTQMFGSLAIPTLERDKRVPVCTLPLAIGPESRMYPFVRSKYGPLMEIYESRSTKENGAPCLLLHVGVFVPTEKRRKDGLSVRMLMCPYNSDGSLDWRGSLFMGFSK